MSTRNRRTALGTTLGTSLGTALAAAVALTGLGLGPGAPGAAGAVPRDRGPALTVPAAALAASLTCHGDPRASRGTPVLLVPGTTLTPDVNFSWNYEKVFTAQGRAWCAVELPGHAMGDIQTSAEYVVQGIRTLSSRAGGRISVVGFSQGGMVPRWALKYWPDTRADVDDLVGLDPSNHGTLDAYPVCAVGGCAAAFWQQQTGSHFLAALNSGPETWAGISYTQVYTATDEVVVPNVPPAPSSALTTGAGAISNVLVQSICPVHVSDHLSMGTSDPVGYALVVDALDHAGPAQASRISPAVCAQAIFPGIDPATYPVDFGRVVATAGEQVLVAPHVAAEPPLRGYAG